MGSWADDLAWTIPSALAGHREVCCMRECWMEVARLRRSSAEWVLFINVKII